MKRELRKAIQEGIKKSELNGYKWEVTPTGLKWSYGEEFNFDAREVEDGQTFLTVKAVQSGITVVALIVGTEFYADCSDLVEAYRIATEATIKKANYLY